MQNINGHDRIEKWIAKFSGERQGVAAKLSLDKARATIKQRFAQQYGDETNIKMILAEAAIPRRHNPFYLSCGREFRGLFNQNFSGGQLLAAIEIVMNKWNARGLNIDILEKIRNTVFTLRAPAP